MFKKLIPPLIILIFKALSSTLRWKMEDHCGITRPGVDEPGPVIWAFWHNRILGVTASHQKFSKQRQSSVLTSPSKDGAILAEVMALIGQGSVRGSSSRGGGTALKELVKTIRSGRDIGITPDGPRGPVYKLAPGLIKLAELSGAPIMPVRIVYHNCWELKSWDRFKIPKPFSKVEVVYGAPYVVERGCDLEAEIAKVEKMLG